MSAFSQSQRAIRVTSSFGGDTLLLGRMSATERLGHLFEMTLTLLSEKGDLNPDTVLGKPLSVTLAGEQQRHFHGLVTEFAQTGYDERLHEYQATVRPWFWFLTRTADCRVFQNKSVPDIFQEVCRQAGLTDFRLALTGSYSPWEYCVQYRETDFTFLSRLLEHEGIFYFFEHTKDKHTLVLSDDAGQLATTPGYDSVPFFPPSPGNTPRERDHLSAWAFRKAFYSGTFATREYDFKVPAPVLAGTASISKPYDASKYEVFDFPADVNAQNSAAVERIAKVRVQELQSAQMMARGSGDAMGLAAGKLFKLTGHPRSDLNIRYLIVSTAIEIANNSFKTGAAAGGIEFNVSLEACDAREPYRTARTTPKPVIRGSQTAVVVGPKGEEIHTDELSRVKVQFHWDRYGKLDENSSCWVRVSQAWAGKSWGAIQIPRIGQEVVVSFLEGDPDRPIIIGSVYNGANKPPYALPDNKTQSGMRSRSSLQGTAENCNEIRFEDKKGVEQVYIHAEKDQSIEVENDETHAVGHDRKKDVKHDETTSIGNDRTETVGANEKISVTKDQGVEIGQRQSLRVGKDQTVDVGTEQKVTIGTDARLSVGKNQTVDVGTSQTTTVGRNVVIDVGDSITIRTGNASLTLRKDGTIALRGRNISIDGSGAINVKASSDVVIKGSKVLSN